MTSGRRQGPLVPTNDIKSPNENGAMSRDKCKLRPADKRFGAVFKVASIPSHNLDEWVRWYYSDGPEGRHVVGRALKAQPPTVTESHSRRH